MADHWTRLARRGILLIYPFVLVLLAWELIARSGTVSPRLMPTLDLILDAFWQALASGELLHHAGISLARALSGFCLAAVLGTVLGVLMARLRIVERLVEPLFSFGYPIPKIALYPLFILALGFGSASKVALITLECLFPIAVNTYFGVRSVPPRLVWSAQNLGASRLAIFWKVLVPAAAPTIFAGLRVALPLSMVVVTITEMIGDSSGLGYFIAYSSASFMYDASYAGVLAIALVGMTLDRTLVFLRNRLIFWATS